MNWDKTVGRTLRGLLALFVLCISGMLVLSFFQHPYIIFRMVLSIIGVVVCAWIMGTILDKAWGSS